ncbi:hypothetical protein B0O99DRAFT_686407 [Bisporella sp. PMI_857]|nr:hypothetical protein B0O99DRAFT_686407 [Bisporella sp. PMI_857]
MYCYVLGTDGAVQYYPANNSSNLSMVTAGQTINGSSLLLPPEVERSILNMAQGVGDILELAAFPLPVLISSLLLSFSELHPRKFVLRISASSSGDFKLFTSKEGDKQNTALLPTKQLFPTWHYRYEAMLCMHIWGSPKDMFSCVHCQKAWGVAKKFIPNDKVPAASANSPVSPNPWFADRYILFLSPNITCQTLELIALSMSAKDLAAIKRLAINDRWFKREKAEIIPFLQKFNNLKELILVSEPEPEYKAAFEKYISKRKQSMVNRGKRFWYYDNWRGQLVPDMDYPTVPDKIELATIRTPFTRTAINRVMEVEAELRATRNKEAWPVDEFVCNLVRITRNGVKCESDYREDTEADAQVDALMKENQALVDANVGAVLDQYLEEEAQDESDGLFDSGDDGCFGEELEELGDDLELEGSGGDVEEASK